MALTVQDLELLGSGFVIVWCWVAVLPEVLNAAWVTRFKRIAS